MLEGFISISIIALCYFIEFIWRKRRLLRRQPETPALKCWRMKGRVEGAIKEILNILTQTGWDRFGSPRRL